MTSRQWAYVFEHFNKTSDCSRKTNEVGKFELREWFMDVNDTQEKTGCVKLEEMHSCMRTSITGCC